MPEPKGDLNFEADVLPHVNAGYNLARWLNRNSQDADGGCPDVNTRAWLFGIVRNTCCAWLLSNRRQQPTIEFGESLFRPHYAVPNPEETLRHHDTRRLIDLALEGLPPKFREVLILRELEGLSYRQISEVTAVPPGTVMSGLSRARGELRRSLAKLAHQGHWSNSMRPCDQAQYRGKQNQGGRAAAGCRVEPARSLYLQTMPIPTGGGRWRGEQPSNVANAVNRSLHTTVLPALRLRERNLRVLSLPVSSRRLLERPPETQK